MIRATQPPGTPWAVNKWVGLTAEYYGISVEELRAGCRSPVYAERRWVAMTLLHDGEEAYSLPHIARQVGLRDHSTVSRGLFRVEHSVRLQRAVHAIRSLAARQGVMA